MVVSSQSSRGNPGILARSKLYRLLVPGVKILDRLSPSDLVRYAWHQSKTNPTCVQIRGHIQRFNAPYWATSNADEAMPLIDEFLDQASQVRSHIRCSWLHLHSRSSISFTSCASTGRDSAACSLSVLSTRIHSTHACRFMDQLATLHDNVSSHVLCSPCSWCAGP